MHLDKTYILNPYYILRPDRHRVVITESGAFFDIPADMAESTIYSFIHPVFAVLLTFFNGDCTLRESVLAIARYFNSSEETARNIVGPLLDNTERAAFETQGHVSVLPRNVLIERAASHRCRDYRAEMFAGIEHLDFSTERLYEGPLDVNLLVNTVCATICEYCYVDKAMHTGCRIALPRLCEIIDEARTLGVRKVDLAGTEVFLYRHWDVLIEHLLSKGYYPYVSTKLPLERKKIARLKDVGISQLQVSIDSLQPSIVSKMWAVEGESYVSKMVRSLEELGRHGIELRVNTVLTRTNASAHNIADLLLKLRDVSSLKKITFNEAGPSPAKTETQFKRFRLNDGQLADLQSVAEDVKQAHRLHFEVAWSPAETKEDFVNTYAVKQDKFRKRATCSAGTRSLTILSDGQVTVCEELYWNPNFIVGNIVDQSLWEVWDSPKARRFSEWRREDFPTDDVCRSCADFDACRGSGVGVCWSRVVQAYGKDAWRHPDPSCPKAPAPTYEIYSGSA